MDKTQLSSDTLKLILDTIEPHLNGALSGLVDDLGFVRDHLLTDIETDLTESFEIKDSVFINKGSIQERELKFLLAVLLSGSVDFLLPCDSPDISLMKSLENNYYLNAKLTYKGDFWELWLTDNGRDYLKEYTNSNNSENVELITIDKKLEQILMNQELIIRNKLDSMFEKQLSHRNDIIDEIQTSTDDIIMAIPE